ncbi:hypothetical protein BD311DRAFT_556243 [Dichomitus squalens]|uniref:HNH nuclease domain-containing protein n=1 Tax=Dichomitus squalens TaxID=114155 RepID=A0A4Q9MBC4_9APHY|nr:hypothetical protein BD311DRAFT_556243 [Dichomitus squalens]
MFLPPFVLVLVMPRALWLVLKISRRVLQKRWVGSLRFGLPLCSGPVSSSTARSYCSCPLTLRGPGYIQAVLPAKSSGGDSDSGDTTPTGRSEDLSRNTVAYRRWAVLRDELYQRDRYRCFMSGAVLDRTPEEALLGVFTTALLVTHIIGVPARARLRHYDQDIALDMLQRYCQVDKDLLRRMAGAYEPQNALLLNPGSHAAFIHFKWCLLPTDVSVVRYRS